MKFTSGKMKNMGTKIFTALFAFSFCFYTLNCNAQSENFDLRTGSAIDWRKEGQLLTIQISKGEPVRIFVVGREEAKFNFTDLKLTVRRLKPYPAKILTLDKQDNYFVVPDASEFQNVQELEIKTELPEKTEIFKIDLKKEKP